MVGELKLNLASKVKSPSETFSIRTQNRDFATETFNQNEADIFQTQFNTLINDLDSRLVTNLYKQREQEIADAAALAKSEFDEKLFGGVNAADNEIAFDVLRPGHIRAKPGTDNENPTPATGDTLNNWYFEPDSNGWNDWIGTGTQAEQYQITEDQVVLVLGFIDLDPNSDISGVNVQEFGRNVDMIPKDLNDARTFDNENEIQIQALPTMVGTENDRVHMRLRHDKQTPSQPRLLGFTFGVGSFMNTEEYPV